MKLFVPIFEVTIHPGLPIFIGAICLNMLCSETMCSLEVIKKEKYVYSDGSFVKIRPYHNSGWRKAAVPLLIFSTFGTLFCALYFPCMKLTASFMRNLSYSPTNMGLDMVEDGYYLFALMVFFFLILMPAVKLIAISVIWFSKIELRNLETYDHIVKAIGKWSMLDVFTFGFCLFLLASDNIVPGVIHQEGLYFLLAYIFLNYALDITTQQWFPQAILIAEA